ncbi:MAG: hypothetical protein AAF458_03275 [Pseudomonadota bacterium]
MTGNDLMFVGSCAYDTAEETFRELTARLGEHCGHLPDGEIGERISWISHLALRVYHGHPDIETLERPLEDDGREAWRAGSGKSTWKFRMRDSVERVRFMDPGWRLGYARDAISSYFVFNTLKRNGVIPGHLRFQVSIPFVSSAVRLYFSNPSDYPKIEPAVTEALVHELRTILAHIPAADLAIQWDGAIEDTVIENALAQSGGEVTDAVRDLAWSLFAPARELNAEIPSEALLGYHACYGTSGGWPRRQPQDLTGAVLLLNAAVAQSGRRVDYLHLPTVAADKAAYFEPLDGLAAAGARVYFGLIHALHDEAGMRKQMEWIGQHLDDFGIAAPCGFGRGPGRMSRQSGLASPRDYMDGLLADHLRAVEMLKAYRSG